MPEYSLEDLQAELSNRETSSESRQQQALDYFQNQGWQPHQAAGIVGNLFHESGMKTSALGDKGASLGIAQWGGPRRKALHEFASQRGSSPYDFNTQLEFINHELNTGEGSAGDALKRAGNIAQATQVFSRYYERPGKPMMGSRLAAAKRLEKMMDITGAKTPSGEPTLEELEAELARREGVEPQAELTLADLEAELARREAPAAAAEQVTGAVTQKALGDKHPLLGALQTEEPPPPAPKLETRRRPATKEDLILGKPIEKGADGIAYVSEQVPMESVEPPTSLSGEVIPEFTPRPAVTPKPELPSPPPAQATLKDPRLTPGATEHLTGRISPEPPYKPTLSPEMMAAAEKETAEAYRASQLAQPAGMPPYSKVELMTKEGELVPEGGVGDPFQPADIPAIILTGGLTAAPKVGIPLALKAMTKSIAPVTISVAAMEGALGALEKAPEYQKFGLPISLAVGVLADVVTRRFGRMLSPTVLRQTIGGGKPVQLSPKLFEAEILQRTMAGMDYKTALHDVAQKYGSSIDELLATAGTKEFQQVAKGSGATAGAEAAETLKKMKPTTGKEETFVAEEKPPTPAPEARGEAVVGEVKAVLGSEFGMRGLAAKRYTVDGHAMGDTPAEAIEQYYKFQEMKESARLSKQAEEEVYPKLKSGNYTEQDIKRITNYGKTTAPTGESEGILRALGMKSTEARKLIQQMPHVSESARGTTYYDVGELIEAARRKGFLPPLEPVEGAPLTKAKRERELAKATEPTPAPAAKGKEAWEMTREEWEKSPDTVYHGATQPFEIQDIRAPGHFTNKEEIARRFAESRAKHAGEEGPIPRVEKAKIKFTNPFVIDAEGDFAGNMQFGKKGEKYRKALDNPEYDGIIIKNTKDEGDLYIATKSGVVKTHRMEVQQALSEGKPVPPEVLKDYPDLAPKAPEPLTIRTVGEVYQDPDGWYRIEGSENKFSRKVEADKAAATIKKYQDVFEEQLEKGEKPLTFYRATTPGKPERIKTGDDYWDSKLFVSDNPKSAQPYGEVVQEVQLSPDTKILREGTRDFIGIAKGLKPREMSMLDWASTITKRAEGAGYDAVWFKRQSDIGTVIINQNKVIPRKPTKPFSPILDEEGFIDMSFLRSPIQFVADMLTQAQTGLGPGAISAEHLKAAEVAGSHLGALHRRGESAAVQLKPFRRMMDKMGVTDPSIPLETNRGVRFMSDMTKPGQPVAAGLEPIRDKISELFGKRLVELRRVGKPLNDVRANYFPGMWTRESRLAFNQAMDEAVWTENRGLSTATGDVLPVSDWSAADKAWVKTRVEELLQVGGGTDKKDMLGYMARRPLAGRETFRKPKVFDDIMTGIEFGLKPISNNPVDLALLKMAEMDRSIWAHGVMKELKGTGDVKFVRTTQKPPPGFVDLDAGRPYAQVYGAYDPKTGARPLYGRWTAKAPAAQIIDNYLSQSLYNSETMGKAYQSLMFGANLLNQWQLMSFFHAGFTTFETQISAGAQILKDLYGVARGNRSLGDLGNTIKEYPRAWTKFAREGNRTLSEWANPSINVPDNVPVSRLAPNTPEAAIVAKAAELAGGGFGMERRWQTHWLDKFIKEVHGGQKVKGALRSPVVFSEMMMKPVLELLVPRQKAAVFGDLVGRLLEQNPGKTLQELRPQLRQAWNRVDSRLGQVRYDRMFMKNSTKNALQAIVRAPGWTGGTIAEIGGAPLDAGRWIKEWAQTGKMPADMPDRVAYTISLLGTMALANGITTLAYDRLSDKPFLKGDNLWAKVKNMDPMDWVAFRTGDKHPDGREVRYLYPTYMKDLFAWYEAPAHTALSKAHPIWSLIYDLKQNKDYYSTMIANPKDPRPTQVMDMGKYVLKSFLPFGVRGMMNVTGESDVGKAIMNLPQEIREEPGKVIAPQFGIMPAPRAMTATPFMKAMDEVFSKAGKPTLTPKQQEVLREKHRVVVLHHKDKIDEAEAKMDELREKGELTKAKEKNLRRKIAEPQTYLFKQMKELDDAIYVWDKASPEEKSYIAGEMEKKLRTFQKKYKAKYAKVETEAERIWNELDTIERQSEAERNVSRGRWSVEMGAEYMERGATKQ